jgi:hypothetical protein
MMKSPQSEASPSPRVHSANIQRELSQLIDHLEADVHRVNDPRFRGLLSKSAEVLTGLRTLFQRFDSAGPEARKPKTTPASRSDKDKEPKAAAATKNKAGEKRSAAPSEKARATERGEQKTKATTADMGADKSGDSPQKRTVPDASSDSAGPSQPAPANVTPRQPDPLEVAARAEQQRREARAPKTPGGHAAPRPMPPRSGKPVWNKPRSS